MLSVLKRTLLSNIYLLFMFSVLSVNKPLVADYTNKICSNMPINAIEIPVQSICPHFSISLIF